MQAKAVHGVEGFMDTVSLSTSHFQQKTVDLLYVLAY